MDWSAIKTVISDEAGLSRDALHLLTGLIVYLVCVAVLPRRTSRWAAWLIVLLLTAANEYADYLYETWPGQWRETLKDFATTMALPSLIILVGSAAPHLLVRGRKKEDGNTPTEEEPVGD